MGSLRRYDMFAYENFAVVLLERENQVAEDLNTFMFWPLSDRRLATGNEEINE